MQGIPSTARRTRVLMQDPVNRQIVYAGTTEGLYKTLDGGTKWTRMTGPDVIINDVHVDPKNTRQVLLATDRSGVLASDDAGASFASSNNGISERQVTALLPDAKHPETMYAGVVNDKSYGGVFVTEDGGKSWIQRSSGLDGRDVFSLAQTDDGTIFAGTNHGLFRWNGHEWEPDGKIVNVKEKTVYVVRHGKKVKKTVAEDSKASAIDTQVSDLSLNGPVWFVATADGVYRSATQGATWTGPVLPETYYRFVDAHGAVVFAARHDGPAPFTGRRDELESRSAAFQADFSGRIDHNAERRFVGGRRGRRVLQRGSRTDVERDTAAGQRYRQYRLRSRPGTRGDYFERLGYGLRHQLRR